MPEVRARPTRRVRCPSAAFARGIGHEMPTASGNGRGARASRRLPRVANRARRPRSRSAFRDRARIAVDAISRDPRGAPSPASPRPCFFPIAEPPPPPPCRSRTSSARNRTRRRRRRCVPRRAPSRASAPPDARREVREPAFFFRRRSAPPRARLGAARWRADRCPPVPSRGSFNSPLSRRRPRRSRARCRAAPRAPRPRDAPSPAPDPPEVRRGAADHRRRIQPPQAHPQGLQPRRAAVPRLPGYPDLFRNAELTTEQCAFDPRALAPAPRRARAAREPAREPARVHRARFRRRFASRGRARTADPRATPARARAAIFLPVGNRRGQVSPGEPSPFASSNCEPRKISDCAEASTRTRGKKKIQSRPSVLRRRRLAAPFTRVCVR